MLKVGENQYPDLLIKVCNFSENQFSYFSNKTYVVGTQNKHLNVTVHSRRIVVRYKRKYVHGLVEACPGELAFPP